MSSPSRSTSPAIAAPGTSWCIRLRMRKNVDFPQPDGPISAVTLPAYMVSETCSRTMWSPNQAVISLASSVASGSGLSYTSVDGPSSTNRVDGSSACASPETSASSDTWLTDGTFPSFGGGSEGIDSLRSDWAADGSPDQTP